MKKQENKVFYINIMFVFIIFIIAILIIAFFRSFIFATSNSQKDNEEIEAKKFEENEDSFNILKIMIENTGSSQRLVYENREIPFETAYKENSQLPLEEEVVTREGTNGIINVISLQEYKDGQFVKEEFLDSKIILDPVTKNVDKGTSEFLKNYNVHIGDKMYLMEIADLKAQNNEESEILCSINRYLNVEILEVNGDWIKVKYKDYEGYVKKEKLTSEAVNPMITEKNRIAKLKEGVNFEMALNVESGLTLSDYKTIFTGILSDKNKIFQDNLEAFYNAEKKYKVNGIFLAAIAIHESGWGTSALAMNKHNLCGFSAYDRDPYNSATTFETYQDCIDTVAQALAKNYLNEAGKKITDTLTASATYHNGYTVSSVNVRYASDQNWANKVYSYMEFLYNRL